jgi:UDP-glucose 4-epimerase
MLEAWLLRCWFREGFNVVIVDSLIEGLSPLFSRCKFIKEDIGNRDIMKNIFTANAVDAVIHMAGETLFQNQ